MKSMMTNKFWDILQEHKEQIKVGIAYSYNKPYKPTPCFYYTPTHCGTALIRSIETTNIRDFAVDMARTCLKNGWGHYIYMAPYNNKQYIKAIKDILVPLGFVHRYDFYHSRNRKKTCLYTVFLILADKKRIQELISTRRTKRAERCLTEPVPKVSVK